MGTPARLAPDARCSQDLALSAQAGVGEAGEEALEGQPGHWAGAPARDEGGKHGGAGSDVRDKLPTGSGWIRGLTSHGGRKRLARGHQKRSAGDWQRHTQLDRPGWEVKKRRQAPQNRTTSPQGPPGRLTPLRDRVFRGLGDVHPI